MIPQIGILLFGMTAVFLVNDHRPSVSKWGPVCGLCAQPFWFYEAFSHEQWGIFVCSFVYCYSWMRGYYNAWWRVSPAQIVVKEGE